MNFFIFYFIDFIIASFIIFILFMILWWKTILTGFVRFTNYIVLEFNSKLSNRQPIINSSILASLNIHVLCAAAETFRCCCWFNYDKNVSTNGKHSSAFSIFFCNIFQKFNKCY